MTRILVVEDQPSLARLLTTALEAAGYDVAVAHDGDEALAVLGGSRFDLVLLDLMLPKADGFEVLEKIGADRPAVIAVSARADPYAMSRAIELGVAHYVTKPYDIDELVGLVAATLD